MINIIIGILIKVPKDLEGTSLSVGQTPIKRRLRRFKPIAQVKSKIVGFNVLHIIMNYL